MPKRLMTLIIAFGVTTGAMATPSSHRFVVVIGRPGDPRMVQQQANLDQNVAALRERDVVVQNFSPETARRMRPDLRVEAREGFKVLLVGKDGSIKMRRDQPVAASEITALIDTMPMRQEEMRR